MSEPNTSPEFEPRFDPRPISRAKAGLLAEGATWLATGEVVRDTAHPVGRLLERLEAVVPLAERYDWLTSQLDPLGGRRPMQLIDADDLAPLQEVLDAMPELPDEVSRSGNGAG